MKYIVYHGTKEKFFKFNKEFSALGGIFWFTNEEAFAKTFANNGYILKCEITINNPAGWEEYDKYGIGELKDRKYDGIILPADDEITYIVFNERQIKILSKEKLTESIVDNILKEGEDRKLGTPLSQQIESKFIVIYRACASDIFEFRDKDYVTLSQKFAVEHAENNHIYHQEPFHVIKAIVSSDNVFDAYNPGEYFYSGPNKKGKEIYTSKGEDYISEKTLKESKDFSAQSGNKLVDKNGEPLIFYHGAAAKFSNFENDSIGKNYGLRLGKGFYFTEILDNAKFYANNAKGSNRRIISVNLYMKQPLHVYTIRDYREAVAKGREQDINGGGRKEVEDDLKKDDNEILQQMGYDGIINHFNDKMNEVVVFNANQIKIIKETSIVEKILKEAEEDENLEDFKSPDYMNILQKKEDLDPELVPYYDKNVLGGMIRHPLIYSMFHSDQMNALINKQFKFKKEKAKKDLASGDYDGYVWLHERPYRLNAFLEVMNKMSDKDYWETLGEIWSDTENAWQNLKIWKKLFKSKRPGRDNLMTPEDLKVYKSLPNPVTAHRGHQGINKSGLSYTLDKNKANWFANRWNKKGKVDTITIPKNRIIAYFSGRGESEIIVI